MVEGRRSRVVRIRNGQLVGVSANGVKDQMNIHFSFHNS